MHVLYVHQNFPAQFGHIAWHLSRQPGWKCTFVSETPAGMVQNVEKIQYKRSGGATHQTHFCSRTFENAIFSCDAVYQALHARPDIQPDLIVGHSGFGSTLFLRDLYPKTPIINLFEFYYRPRHPESDMGYRSDLNWQLPESFYMRARARNAMILLDLENCSLGYCPTAFQRSTFPEKFHPKIDVIFDGVERNVYHGHNETLRPPPSSRSTRNVAGIDIPATTRLVTYVSRGFESMRCFDLFMRSAKLIAERYPDVVFLVVGADRVAYGGDETFLPPGTTFKQWTLSQAEYDLSKFCFLGTIPPPQLALLLAATDLHIYLTVPFVLSWSMMDAMSCGAVVLGSGTSPVTEMIRNGENGFVADVFDIEGLADKAVRVLRDPAEFRPLGRAAEQMIEARFSVAAVLPEMVRMYERAAGMTVSG